jgi:hypothetical protein
VRTREGLNPSHFSKEEEMAKNSTYDSVKQGQSHTTYTGKPVPKGPVQPSPSKSEWVSESATADKPIFYTSKDV